MPPRRPRSRRRPPIVMAPPPPPDELVVGGRIDSQGRLMLQHASGVETVAGKVAGAPGQPGEPGTPATTAQVTSALSAWMAANPFTQVVYSVTIPATTIVVSAVTKDVTVTWPKPWPDATYEVVGFVVTSGLLLGKIVAGEPKSKTTTTCVVPVEIAATLAAGGAKMHVLGMRA